MAPALKMPPSKRKDYKEVTIQSLIKILKKIKCFFIRQLLRQASQNEAKNSENSQNESENEETSPEQENAAAEAQKIVDRMKEIKNPNLRSAVPFLISFEFGEKLDKYWEILEKMKVTTKEEHKGLSKKLVKKLVKKGVSLPETFQPDDSVVENPDISAEKPLSGLLDFLVMLLKRRPKQYLTTLDSIRELLSKISAKAQNSKANREKKKERLKEKIERGEFKPKKEYEEGRKDIRQRIIEEKMEAIKKKKEKTEKKREKVEKVKEIKKNREEKKRERKEKGEGEKVKEGKKGEKKEGGKEKGEKKEWKKEKGEKKEFKKDKKEFKKDKKEDKEDKETNILTKVVPKMKGKDFHPSWQAKVEERQKMMVLDKPNKEVLFE